MTSLSRAATASRGLESSGTESDRVTGGGIFEHSFGGLDLSEFGLPGGGGGRPSAAAELMQTKAKEAQRIEMEAKEESEIRANAVTLAQERSQRLKDEEDRLMEGGKALVDENRPSGGTEFLTGGFYSALVSMHGGDDGTRKERSTGSSNTLKKVKRRSVPILMSKSGSAVKMSKVVMSKGSGSKLKKKGMAKKSKRAKY